MNKIRDFLGSEAGARARHQMRKQRMVFIDILDIEPQSKKMPGPERDRFQQRVAQQLTLAKRMAFNGDVALKIDLTTTSKNAPQAHTITKNLLDLLSERRLDIQWPRKHLLYKDDRQIQALSVTCRHGKSHPRISIEARPFKAMLDDLELAAEIIRMEEMADDAWQREMYEEDWVKTFSDFRVNETAKRRIFGDSFYDNYIKMLRWSAQRELLGRSGVNIPVLGWMFGRPSDIPLGFGAREWAKLLGRSKLRLQVGELPIGKGSSETFKKAISAEIAAFKQRWDWIIDPLVLAVGLEVVVRPNPATPAAVLHDLDNIVRDYLIPNIVPSFGTVTDQRWTIDFDELRRTNPDIAGAWGPNPTPPVSTKWGVTRYEVWRLPPIENEPGFVSVAIVADVDATGDLMDNIDATIRRDGEKRRGHRYW